MKHYIHIVFLNIKEEREREGGGEGGGVCERERKCERMCVSITDDGQNWLSRK